MNWATNAQRRLAPVLFAAALWNIALSVAAADTAAPAVPATASQRLQQRFTAAAEGWRKAVLKLPGAMPHEAELVRELRVVVAPTPVPLLRVQRRLDGHTVIVSAGWLALLDQLLRAEAVSHGAADEGTDCLSGYSGKLMAVVRQNRDRAAEAQQPRQAWPRLAVLVESGAAPTGCTHLKSADLQRPALQAQVDKDANAAAFWLLTHQAALLVALPVPPAVPASGASASEKAAAPAPADEVTLRLRPPRSAWLFLAPPAPAASAASTPPSKPTAAAALSAAAFADERAQQALKAYDLKQPRALSWMRDNAAKLFDAETVETLRR